jgi:hypothetical protein
MKRFFPQFSELIHFSLHISDLFLNFAGYLFKR